MNFKIKNAFTCLIYFLLLAVLMFGFQWFLQRMNYLGLDFKIHFLIFILSLIVICSVALFYMFGPGDKIGFVFLGFVVFKMFGIGYLAYFQDGFRQHLVPYFVIFWIYLTAEAIATVWLLRKQDINHKKQLKEKPF